MKQWKLWMHNARGRGGLSWLSKIRWLRITGCRKVLLSWWHDEAMKKDINAKSLRENIGGRAPSIYLAGVRESQIADPFWGEKGFEIWILLWRLQRVGIMNASKDFIFWSCCKGFDFVNSVLNRIRIRKGSCQQHAKSPVGSRIRTSSTIWLRKFSMMWQFWTREARCLISRLQNSIFFVKPWWTL